MPFTTSSGEGLTRIHLAQVVDDPRYFQLQQEVVYREREGAIAYRAPVQHGEPNREGGTVTDLASVPHVLWSFIASYGRQSLPAIVHDRQSYLADGLEPRSALRFRKEVDRIFREGLREQKVPLFRAWLMWAFVSLERYWRYSPWIAVVLIGQLVVSVAAVYVAVWASIVGIPVLMVLLTVPVVLWLVSWKERQLVGFLTVALLPIAPFLIVHVLSIAPMRASEWLVREAIDRPFLDRHPGPVVVPTVGPARPVRTPAARNAEDAAEAEALLSQQ